MIQNSYNPPARPPLLHAAILEEIIASSAAHVLVDELALAMSTHPGSKRDRNEDRLAVARITAPNSETYTVALVCDGVGGSEFGDLAATFAIVSIIADLAQQRSNLSLMELSAGVIRRADDYVRNQLQGRGSTTLVLLLATADGHMVCANVGDSRAYSWNPALNKLDQVTIDDTIENELKNLPGNPDALIKARGLQGRLSQALGESGRTAEELRIQIYPKEYFPNGVVLGSDGLWRAAKDFEKTVANSRTPADAVRRAIALANWVGGVDNASIIALSDVNYLCGEKKDPRISGQQPVGITLWSSSVKIKILTSDLLFDVKPPQGRIKPERQKRNSKKKESQHIGDESQLNLEPANLTESKPKIEVTIGDDFKKNI